PYGFVRDTPEQGKMPTLTQILGDGIVSLRVCRVEALRRRGGLLHRSACCVGLLPGALVQRQRREDVIIVRHRGTLRVLLIESAQAWKRFACLCGEQGPPLHRFLFV